MTYNTAIKKALFKSNWNAFWRGFFFQPTITVDETLDRFWKLVNKYEED